MTKLWTAEEQNPKRNDMVPAHGPLPAPKGFRRRSHKSALANRTFVQKIDSMRKSTLSLDTPGK